MDAKVVWNQRMSFTGTADSGFQLNLGTDPAVGGDNDGFRPMELLAIGLAGCTAMDVISILSKKRQQVQAFDVQVHAARASEHPKVFTDAVIEYTFVGHNIEEAAVLRAIELSAVRYCPAQAMLSKAMSIELKYTIYEDLSDGKRSLVAVGAYVPAAEVNS
ncbi:MAG: OsmC family protein [Chloroflexota bacterium]